MRPVIENVYRHRRYSLILRGTHESTAWTSTSVDRRWLPDVAVNVTARLGQGRSHRPRWRETGRTAPGAEKRLHNLGLTGGFLVIAFGLAMRALALEPARVRPIHRVLLPSLLISPIAFCDRVASVVLGPIPFALQAVFFVLQVLSALGITAHSSSCYSRFSVQLEK